MVCREFVIGIQGGLRARPAAMLVQVASRYESEILFAQGDKQIDAKSIIGILAMGVRQGECIGVCIEGPDERQAMQALTSVMDGGFGGF